MLSFAPATKRNRTILYMSYASWGIGLIITFASIGSLQAQVNRLELRASDSTSYTLFVSGVPQLEMVSGTQVLDSIAPGPCLIDLMVHDSVPVHLRVDLKKKANYPLTLLLERNAEDASTPYALRRLRAEGEPEDYTHPAGQAENSLQVEVLMAGEGSCAPPASPASLLAAMAELENTDFERERVKMMERLISSNCLTTKQIGHLVELIEDESRRLRMLQRAYKNCFDPSNYAQLSELLYLSKSKEAFSMWLARQ